MSSGQQVQNYYQELIKLFGNTMSESQINYLVSQAERVSDMEETLASLQQSLSQMMET